jgi:hypothetical protein
LHDLNEHLKFLFLNEEVLEIGIFVNGVSLFAFLKTEQIMNIILKITFINKKYAI